MKEKSALGFYLSTERGQGRWAFLLLVGSTELSVHTHGETILKIKNALFSACLLGLVGCGGEPLEDQDASPSEVTDEHKALYATTGTQLWGIGAHIPVCWVLTGYDSEKSLMVQALKSTWEAYGNVTFDWLGNCPTSGTQNAVRVRVERGSDAGGGGSSRLGKAALMAPTTDTNSYSTHIALPQSGSIGRIEYLAVHEFGHVLGFAHEQDRPDNTSSEPACNPTGSQAGTYYTGFDQESVMDYCNSGRNSSGRLSDGDKNGVAVAYGSRGWQSLFWHNGSTGASQWWYMNGTQRAGFVDFPGSLTVTDATSWKPAGLNDLNSNNRREILWHNGTSGASQIWKMRGSVRESVVNLDSSLNVADNTSWRIVAFKDFNRDGKTDLLWHNGSTGAIQLWYMNGATRTSFANFDSSLTVPASTGWRIDAVNDFNRDGNLDLLWHNGTTGATQVWYMNGIVRTGLNDFSPSLNVADSTGWRIVGTNDLNGDGKTDLIWHNGVSGATQAWFLNGVYRLSFSNFDSTLNVADSTGWRVIGR